MINHPHLDLPGLQPGHVWLVGAGPGDPGLLSVLALHALQQANAIVYDALVDPRILALARTEALLQDAGKRGGRPSARQPDISARLIALARERKRVLRLKGGDPCVFGRGGEEALALAEDRKSTRLNSSHVEISYAVFCLKKKKKKKDNLYYTKKKKQYKKKE